MPTKRRHLDAGLADESFADQAGKAKPQKGERKPRRHLVGHQREREKSEEQRHGNAGEQSRRPTPSKVDPVRSATAKPAHRAHHHHAFDAEIEHAGALDHQFADGGNQQAALRR